MITQDCFGNERRLGSAVTCSSIVAAALQHFTSALILIAMVSRNTAAAIDICCLLVKFERMLLCFRKAYSSALKKGCGLYSVRPVPALSPKPGIKKAAGAVGTRFRSRYGMSRHPYTFEKLGLAAVIELLTLSAPIATTVAS